MFFDSWTGLLRVLVGGCAYSALILFLRLSGKRTLRSSTLSISW